MRYMQTARFEQDGAPITGTLTATEGEPLTLHVSRAYASLQNYTGEYSAFSGAKLYVSPENSGTTAAAAGEAAAPTFDTGYQTDANGDVTVTLYGSGWVHLYAVDPRDGKGLLWQYRRVRRPADRGAAEHDSRCFRLDLCERQIRR